MAGTSGTRTSPRISRAAWSSSPCARRWSSGSGRRASRSGWSGGAGRCGSSRRRAAPITPRRCAVTPRHGSRSSSGSTSAATSSRQARPPAAWSASRCGAAGRPCATAAGRSRRPSSARLPLLPVVEEAGLRDRAGRERFLARVLAYRRLLAMRSLLQGGDRRSLARSSRALELVRAEPDRVSDLAALAVDRDGLVAMRALDALEKLARERPEWVEPHKHVFLGAPADSERWEVRLQVVRALPLPVEGWREAARPRDPAPGRRAPSDLREGLGARRPRDAGRTRPRARGHRASLPPRVRALRQQGARGAGAGHPLAPASPSRPRPSRSHAGGARPSVGRPSRLRNGAPTSATSLGWPRRTSPSRDRGGRFRPVRHPPVTCAARSVPATWTASPRRGVPAGSRLR